MGRNKKYSLRKENHRKKDTTKTQEERYYITSLRENVEQLKKVYEKK